MGQVWQATQNSTGQTVAVKFLKPELASSSHLRVAFEHEVRLAASLNHPSIARVYDSGLHLGTLFYIMECVDGVRIDQYCTEKQVGVRGIVELFIQVGDSVHFAHSRGVIHLDLKPANILVEKESGRPKVLDFGLARTVSDAGATMFSGHPYGTLGYMPPEQARGEAADARSDVYALGASMIRLLTGKHPYDASGTQDSGFARAAAGPEPLVGRIDTRFEGDLRAILIKATRPAIDQRYASVSELTADLRNWLAGDPVSAMPQSLLYVSRRKINKHRVIAAMISAAALLFVGSVGTLVVLAARSQVAEEMRIDSDRKSETAIRSALGVLLCNLPEPMNDRMYIAVTDEVERRRLITVADEFETLARQAMSSSNPALHALAARIRLAQAETALLLGDAATAITRLDAALTLSVPPSVSDPRERLARSMLLTRNAQIEMAAGMPNGSQRTLDTLAESIRLTTDLSPESLRQASPPATDSNTEFYRVRGWALITGAVAARWPGVMSRDKIPPDAAKEGLELLQQVSASEALQGKNYLKESAR
jgi:serine/threonine protein kinase